MKKWLCHHSQGALNIKHIPGQVADIAGEQHTNPLVRINEDWVTYGLRLRDSFLKSK